MTCRGRAISGKRLALLVVAAFLSAAAALAIGILLFGDFGATEGRILATTALLAGYGLLALPGAILRDQQRLAGLAVGVIVLAVLAAALGVVSVWQTEPSDALGNAVGTLTAWLVAAAQVAALAARQGDHDPGWVRRLFAASTVLVVIVAAMFTALLWAELEREGFIRVFAALVVLDALLVALQPLFARTRPVGAVHRLRVATASGETIELHVEAPDLAAAAAKAIRTVEREGRRVRLLEVVVQAAEPNDAAGERRHAKSPIS